MFLATNPLAESALRNRLWGSLRSMRAAFSQATLLSGIIPPSFSVIGRSSESGMSAYPASADPEKHHRKFYTVLESREEVRGGLVRVVLAYDQDLGFQGEQKVQCKRVESACNVDDDGSCGASFDSLIRHTLCRRNWQQIAKVCTHPCNKETFQMLQVKSEWNPNPHLSMCSMLETCLSAIIHMAVTCIDYGCRLYTSFL